MEATVGLRRRQPSECGVRGIAVDMSSRLVSAPSIESVLAHWAAISTRVAWTLLRLGVKPRPDVFADARIDAVLRILDAPPAASIGDAADAATEAWVARLQGQPPPPWPEDWFVPVSPSSVQIRDDDPDLLVLRRHYGDHRRLVDLVRAHGITLDTLEATRARLRRAARATLGDPTAAPARCDRVLQRLAGWTRGDCPPPETLRDHRAHVSDCPVCDRTLRLIGRDVLPVDAFVAPRPFGVPQVDVVVLQLHPEAAPARAEALDALPGSVAHGLDGIVAPRTSLENLEELVPRRLRRRHLRGLRRQGPGALSPRGIAGPLLDGIDDELAQVPWGRWTTAKRPPTPARALTSMLGGMALVFGIAALVVGGQVLTSAASDPSRPDVAFDRRAGFTRAVFDVPEDAWVSAFGLHDGQVRVVLWAGSSSDKAALATGDGRYELVTEGDALLLAIHDGPLIGLPDALAHAQQSEAPLSTLAAGLRPQATVRWSPADAR